VAALAHPFVVLVDVVLAKIVLVVVSNGNTPDHDGYLAEWLTASLERTPVRSAYE
jgi:hypothetical protein